VECDFVPNSIMVATEALPPSFAFFPPNNAPAVLKLHMPSSPVLVRAHLFFLVEQIARAGARFPAYDHNPDLAERVQLCLYLHDLWHLPVVGAMLHRPARLVTPVPAARALPEPPGQAAPSLHSIEESPAGNTRSHPYSSYTFDPSGSSADILNTALRLWQEGQLKGTNGMESEEVLEVDGYRARILEYQQEQEELRRQGSKRKRPLAM
jgi:hypothetical protein